MRLSRGRSSPPSTRRSSTSGAAVADDDRTVLIWNAETREVVQELPGHGERTYDDLSWSPDDRLIVTSGADKILKVWNAADGTRASQFSADKSYRPRVWVDADQLVVCEGGSYYALIQASTGELLDRVSGHAGDVLGLSHAARTVFFNIGGWGAPRRWKLGTGTHDAAPPGLSGYSVVSHNRNTLAVEEAGSVRLMNLDTEEPAGAVVCDAVANDGKALIVAPSGHFRVSPASAERDLRYIVKTDAGEQLTLTAEEFTKTYGWKNDPEQVQLVSPPVADESGSDN